MSPSLFLVGYPGKRGYCPGLHEIIVKYLGHDLPFHKFLLTFA